MGVYIKGMEMPTNRPEHTYMMVFPSGEVWEVRYDDNRIMKYGTAIEIPMPHGRLTKRLVYRVEVYNALEAERIKSLDGILTDPYKDGFHDGLKRALQILANDIVDAPTIIPAEEEE